MMWPLEDKDRRQARILESLAPTWFAGGARRMLDNSNRFMNGPTASTKTMHLKTVTNSAYRRIKFFFLLGDDSIFVSDNIELLHVCRCPPTFQWAIWQSFEQYETQPHFPHDRRGVDDAVPQLDRNHRDGWAVPVFFLFQCLRFECA